MKKKLNIAIIGLGNIGSYLYTFLKQKRKILSKKSQVDLNIAFICDKKRKFKVPKNKWLKNYLDAPKISEIDLIVELIGGAEGPAKKLVFSALKNKKHVVTANKALISKCGNQLAKIAEKNNSSSLKVSKSNEERLKFWAGRKAAFPACGVLAPDYMCMDGSIPRGKLAEVLNEISRLSKKYNLPVANAFHAGDGNLHPLIMFDANDKESLRKCEEFGADILKYCVKVGGALTGEHGVGIEKRELMCEAFNDKDIQQQLTIKVALDPNSLLNPGKVYPIPRKCAEEGRVHVHGGKTKFPDIPRF